MARGSSSKGLDKNTHRPPVRATQFRMAVLQIQQIANEVIEWNGAPHVSFGSFATGSSQPPLSAAMSAMPPKAKVNSNHVFQRSRLDVRKRFKTIEKRPLTCENLFPSQRESEPRCAIDLGKVRGPTALGRPFDSDVIAAYSADIEIACQRIAPDYLAGTLAYLAERLRRPCTQCRVLLRIRRAADSASSPPSCSPLGIDQASKSRLRQKGPPDGPGDLIRCCRTIHQCPSTLSGHGLWSGIIHSAAAVSVLAAPSRDVAASLGWRSVAPTLHFLVRSRIAFLARPDLSDLCGRLDPGGAFPRVAGNYAAGAVQRPFNPNDKANLAPYRFRHLAILIVLGARLIPLDAPGLQGSHLAAAGQMRASNRSKCFVSESLLSFIASLVLERISGGIVAQLLVGAGGLAIMRAVAYYRS